ncbi:MAG: hypothetical protein AAFO03_14400 [Bacteroidota bacterium]
MKYALPLICMLFALSSCQRNDELVEVHLDDYEVFKDSSPFELVIQGDTLQFDDQVPYYIEYVLPTEKKSDNELVVTLLSEDQLTGEPYISEVIFEYYVNE